MKSWCTKNFTFNKLNKHYSIRLKVEYKDCVRFKRVATYKSDSIKGLNLIVV